MVLDADQAFLHADALTETCVKPPHLRYTERMLATEEIRATHVAQKATQKTQQRYGLFLQL